jgi:hypothetical protein
MRKGAFVFCGFLIAVSGFAIFTAAGWSFKTKLFPLSVAIPLLALSTVQLVLMILGKEETNEGAMDVEFATDVPPEIARRRVVGVFCWIVGFIALVYLLGFPWTTPLFIFLYLRFQSEVSWTGALASAAVTWGCFHLLFQSLVHIQFEAGAIQTWLGL